VKDFEAYLVAFPGAHLDPGAYPKSVLKAFEKVRADVESRGAPGAGDGDTSLAAAYETWKRSLPPESAAVLPKERWAQSALRFLMTKQEKDDWEKLSDDVSRTEFAAAFWRRRDPDPATPENEFRDEMEYRVRFANERFAQGEKRGSETDRGMVFLLLGPPSYAGRSILTADDDALQVQRNAPLESYSRDARGRLQVTLQARDPLTAERLQGTREIWHYRRDKLHKAVGFAQLDVEFITKQGYGEAVLERDQNTLAALGKVAQAYIPTR
jgi:GWxTD domain-containing protein